MSNEDKITMKCPPCRVVGVEYFSAQQQSEFKLVYRGGEDREKADTSFTAWIAID